MDIKSSVIDFEPEIKPNEFAELIAELESLPAEKAMEVGPFKAVGDLDANTVAARALSKMQKASSATRSVRKRGTRTGKDGLYLILQSSAKIVRNRAEKSEDADQ